MRQGFRKPATLLWQQITIETPAGEEPVVIMIQSMPGPKPEFVLQQKLLFDA